MEFLLQNSCVIGSLGNLSLGAVKILFINPDFLKRLLFTIILLFQHFLEFVEDSTLNGRMIASRSVCIFIHKLLG